MGLPSGIFDALAQNADNFDSHVDDEISGTHGFDNGTKSCGSMHYNHNEKAIKSSFIATNFSGTISLVSSLRDVISSSEGHQNHHRNHQNHRHHTSFLKPVGLLMNKILVKSLEAVKQGLCRGGGEWLGCYLNKFGTGIEKCEGWCGLFGTMWMKSATYEKNCHFRDKITYPWTANRGFLHAVDPTYKQVRKQVCCNGMLPILGKFNVGPSFTQCWDVDGYRIALLSMGGSPGGETVIVVAGRDLMEETDVKLNIALEQHEDEEDDEIVDRNKTFDLNEDCVDFF